MSAILTSPFTIGQMIEVLAPDQPRSQAPGNEVRSRYIELTGYTFPHTEKGIQYEAWTILSHAGN